MKNLLALKIQIRLGALKIRYRQQDKEYQIKRLEKILVKKRQQLR